MTNSGSATTSSSSSGGKSTSGILSNIGSLWASNSNRQEAEEEVGKGCTSDDFYSQLESGLLRENLSMAELGPTPPERRWRQANVRKVGKAGSRAYEMSDGNGLIFSARLDSEGSYLISMYPHKQEDKREHYCAILKPTGKHGYTLLSCSCEGCDRMGRCCQAHCQDCGGFEVKQTRGRQVLARITQSVQWEESTGTDMRNLAVQLPRVNKDKTTRAVWCPRTPAKEDGSDSIDIITKMPRFSEQVGCLVMDFHGDRVKVASTKNFVMALKGSRPLFQFGKSNDKNYVLDHRFPLAPIQAFAIGLSMCSWRVPIPSQSP